MTLCSCLYVHPAAEAVADVVADVVYRLDFLLSSLRTETFAEKTGNLRLCF